MCWKCKQIFGWLSEYLTWPHGFITRQQNRSSIIFFTFVIFNYSRIWILTATPPLSSSMWETKAARWDFYLWENDFCLHFGRPQMKHKRQMYVETRSCRSITAASLDLHWTITIKERRWEELSPLEDRRRAFLKTGCFKCACAFTSFV